MNAKAKAWIAGGAAVAVLVLAVGWFALVTPKKDEVSSVQAQATTLVAENSRLQAQINQLRKQSEQITNKQVRLAQIAKRVPGDPQLPALIRRLTAAARTAGVDLVTITPTTPSAANAYDVGAAPYQQIGLSMEAHGTFASMEEWFRQLEDPSLRLIVAEKVNLTPATSANGAPTDTVKLGPGGIPETSRTITATVTARAFTTDAASVTADLPALSGVAAATTNPSS